MRIALLETIVMPIGHEVEFDRILVDNMNKLGHKPIFFVPKNYPFKLEYNAEVEYLDGGEAISYANVSRVKKIWLSIIREHRRVAWLDSAFQKAQQGKCDAIMIPTASWRMLRSLLKSKLKNSPIPVLVQLHGLIPSDYDNLFSLVKKLKPYKNIHIDIFGMQTLKDYPQAKDCPNFHTVLPMVYLPHELDVVPEFKLNDTMRLGFFGQYRKEKNIEFFLDAFLQAKFTTPVELLMQGATVTPVDSEDFERIAKKYSGHANIKFLHKNLIGAEWEQQLLDCDIILMPYGAERYRYQPSAMLFNAIGYCKPVLQSPEMSPEVLEEFSVGEAVRLDSVETFARQLEKFVNEFRSKADKYKKGIEGANSKYSQENLVKQYVKILGR